MILTRDMILTAAEVNKLYAELSAAKDLALHRRVKWNHIRDHYIIKTLLETGLRVFELTALRVGDIRGNAVIVRNGKFNKKREVILTQYAQFILKEWIKLKSSVLNESLKPDDFLFVSQWRKPFTTTGVRLRVKYWFAKCGFDLEFSCHTCRHSYVSHGLASGVDLIRMKENVGHASLNTTSIYAHAVNNDLGDLDIYRRKSFVSTGKRNFSRKAGS
jgi:integrase/recombinase XerD